MSDTNFKLPAYIQSPLFLYQDKRLDKSSLLIASFFYSITTAGGQITASKEYLCELGGIKRSQYFETMNKLESLGYISRKGLTNRTRILWVYKPKSIIEVQETDDKDLNTSPVHRTKLVRSTGLNLSGPPDTYNKEDNKEDNIYIHESESTELNLDITCLEPAKTLIERNRSMDRAISLDALSEIARPIPATKPSTKPSNIYIPDSEKIEAPSPVLKEEKKEYREVLYTDNLPAIQPPLCQKEMTVTEQAIVSDNIHGIPHNLINDWVVLRRKRRAHVNHTTWEELNKELTICKNNGIDPVEAFKKMVVFGWPFIDAQKFIDYKAGGKADIGSMDWGHDINEMW